MSKEYFSHDYNARSDPKLARVLMKLGTDGLGIYWCLIEMLYEQNGYISLDHIETIAFELHQQCNCITSVLKDFDLFKFQDDKFYSESVLKRLNIRADKSEKTRSAALKRWSDYADAKQTQSKSNAIKGNNSKVNKRKGKSVFVPPTLEQVKEYFAENGYREEIAIKAFNSYSVANWHDSKNNPISNWKQKMINVWFREEHRLPPEKPITGFRGLNIKELEGVVGKK